MSHKFPVLMLVFVLASLILIAKETQEVKIKTSAQCEMCKDRIEKALNKSKGVVSSDLDLDTKEVTVVYEPDKIDIDKIKQIISKTGYNADDVPANKKAYNKLPKCCQISVDD